MRKITPCLWFDRDAYQAAKYYISIFKNSKITKVARYGKEGHEIHGMPEGTVLTVDFELNGNSFLALNGGPMFKFSEAVSFVIDCKDQKELDHYWGRLSNGGDPKAQQCGWLKDKYGVSWQIVPSILSKLMSGKDPRKSERVMKALLQMKKLDIAGLKKAAKGK